MFLPIMPAQIGEKCINLGCFQNSGPRIYFQLCGLLQQHLQSHECETPAPSSIRFERSRSRHLMTKSIWPHFWCHSWPTALAFIQPYKEWSTSCKVLSSNVSTSQDRSTSAKCFNSSLTCQATETSVLQPTGDLVELRTKTSTYG